jgi:hypothetical protein
MPKEPESGIWRSMRGLCFGSAAANFFLIVQFISTSTIPARIVCLLIAEIPILIAAGMLYEMLEICGESVHTRLANWTSTLAGIAVSSNLTIISLAFGAFQHQYFIAAMVGGAIAIAVYGFIAWFTR